MSILWISVAISSVFLAGTAEVDPAIEALAPPQRRMLDPLRERILDAEALVDSLGLRGDEQVADVGAGPGFFTLKLAKRLPHGKVIATDIDAAALAVVGRRAAAAGLTNIETHPVSAADPGLAASSIDVAFLCQVDHYLKSRGDYFRALRGALKPRGRLVLVNMASHHDDDRAAAMEAGFQLVRDAALAPGSFVMIWEKVDK